MVETPYEHFHDVAQTHIETLTRGHDLGVFDDDYSHLYIHDPARPIPLVIRDPELVTIATLARKANTPETVQRNLEAIEEAFKKRNSLEIEAAILHAYLLHKQELLAQAGAAGAASKDVDLPIPPDRAGQLAFAETLLGQIEDTVKDSSDFLVGGLMSKIDINKRKFLPEVQKIINARIAVHECAVLMDIANGKITGPNKTNPMAEAAEKAKARGHDITPEVVGAILGTGIPGLRTIEAWDLLQDAVYSYRDMLIDINRETLHAILSPKGISTADIDSFVTELSISGINGIDFDRTKITPSNISAQGARLAGPAFLSPMDWRRLHRTDPEIAFNDEPTQGRVEANYYTDREAPRKNAVREYMIRLLGGGRPAEKSLQIAEKFARATMETSAFNRGGMAGSDDLAELLGFDVYRVKSAQDLKPHGPEVTMPFFDPYAKKQVIYYDSIGTTFLRMASKRQVDIKQPLYAADVDPNRINPYDYFFGGVVGGKFNAVAEALLKTDYDLTKDFTPELLQGLSAKFDAVDPKVPAVRGRPESTCGPKCLKTKWLEGVIDTARLKEQLTPELLATVERIAVNTPLDSRGRGFIREDQWQDIMEDLPEIAHDYWGGVKRDIIKSLLNVFGDPKKH